jgi:cleavage and polyadenylation specificity factor subunit 1
MGKAFQESKNLLARVTLLAHPMEEALVSVACDASATHVGAVLQQQEGTDWRPLSFFSRKLSAAEKNYSTFDRELLAAHAAVKHFRFFLEGREFILFTDHKPLVAAMKRVSPPTSARQQRQLAFLSEFAARFQHTAGTDNVVADTLSRPSISAILGAEDILDFEEMAKEQRTCLDTQQLIANANHSLQVQGVAVGQHVLHGDVSTGIFRPLVPEGKRRLVFEKLHSVSHPGIRATRRLIASRYVWRGLAADVGT